MIGQEFHAFRLMLRATAGALSAGRWLPMVGLLLLGAQAVQAQDREVITCGGAEELKARTLKDTLVDLKVDGTCYVRSGGRREYYYGQVNVVAGGQLEFTEAAGDANRDSTTDFWASSIIIENGGQMEAYALGHYPLQPYGDNGGTLTIRLYGKNEAEWDYAKKEFKKQNKGAFCTTEGAGGPCGIPERAWNSDRTNKVDLPGYDRWGYQQSDYFYQYGPLYGDRRCSDDTVFDDGKCGDGSNTKAKVGYFGNKVLAVSYGGKLNLRGYKGSMITEREFGWDPWNSAWSWTRLADGSSLRKGDSSLVVETDPEGKWKAGDEIVVTTTDYLPGHSEKLRINANYKGGTTIGFEAVDSPDKKIQWPHNGLRYGGPLEPNESKRWTKRLPDRLLRSMDDGVVGRGAETRAAVALLTRSIRIVSAGDEPGTSFGYHSRKDEETDIANKNRAHEDPKYSYGAHMVIRQGFKSIVVQGVEFHQMGQGGRLAHYPVHFHMAREAAYPAFIVDSSINESMTRWIVLHSTQGVALVRNVGYKSIGHGFYLEDGTETDNKFYSNIGIFARAGVKNAQNPREIPGILADNQDPDSADFKAPNVANQGFPYRSDNEYPTVFWITNGWNDFKGNMAAGAGACGAAYWFVPAANSDHIEVRKSGDSSMHMKWSGYASLQQHPTPLDPRDDAAYAGTTPLMTFHRNYATSAMHSFQTTVDAPRCYGFIAADAKPGAEPVLQAVPSLAPNPTRHTVGDHTEPDNYFDHYYPHVKGGERRATHCRPTRDDKGRTGYDCTGIPPCGTGDVALKQCGVTVLDLFTSAFHWAEGNVSAIWLRPKWYLLINSVLSDVQNGGLTFVSGGDYTHSSAIQGYWALARNSVFIGNTVDVATNPFASNTGPFNAETAKQGVKCEDTTSKPAYCINFNEGISMPTSGFFTNQRLANIYDGPSYQDSNAYLDIMPADCPRAGYNKGCMYGTDASYLRLKKVPGDAKSPCFLPNAAIGWKQPNGFLYPPAFHSRNLFFDNVELRHFVIDPLFTPGTYLTNEAEVQKHYCLDPERTGIFGSFTAIDRQTVLNDADGSLTGLRNSLAEQDPLNQTISINEDEFFKAPLETPECGSIVAANGNAANACNRPDATKPPPTARTSPFDYLMTVVYRKPKNAAEEALWRTDCATPACYGVPLYRQYLTDAEMTSWTPKCDAQKQGEAPDPACRWPFIRMAGVAIAQRETLTINNGVYYLDTTVTEADQKKENFSNLSVFKKDEQYTLFFVYAKSSTVQTYQIYVGPGFKKDGVDFKTGRVKIDDAALPFTPDAANKGWADADYKDGLLTVTVRFGGLQAELAPTPQNGLCKPEKFCKADGASCVTALDDDDPRVRANRKLRRESDAVCRQWAVKDLDCPLAGCLAFSFTPKVEADGKYHRPKPEAFPKDNKDNKQGKPDWTTKFSRTSKEPDNSKGICYYPKIPGSTDCKP